MKRVRAYVIPPKDFWNKRMTLRLEPGACIIGATQHQGKAMLAIQESTTSGAPIRSFRLAEGSPNLGPGEEWSAWISMGQKLWHIIEETLPAPQVIPVEPAGVEAGDSLRGGPPGPMEEAMIHGDSTVHIGKTELPDEPPQAPERPQKKGKKEPPPGAFADEAVTEMFEGKKT